MKGSPDFLPPEVFKASRKGPFELYKVFIPAQLYICISFINLLNLQYTSGIDLWAAGVILHLMATGLTPFAGLSDVQIAGIYIYSRYYLFLNTNHFLNFRIN